MYEPYDLRPWAEFFFTVASAAAALAGLIIVALSVYGGFIARSPTHRAHARALLVVLAGAMLTGLIAIAEQPPTWAGWEFGTVSLGFAAINTYNNRRTLAQMKPTAFLINTARGGLVCEADLVEALQAKRLAGAGLDVFETEPPGQTALLQLDSVVCTPHSASSDLQARDDITLAAARAVVALSRGEWPAEQIVNPRVRETFRWE